MLTGKKALKNFILWVAAGLLLVAGITVVFDPFYQYHGPLPGMKDVLFERESQVIGSIRHFSYDSVLLGSSVVENCDSSYLDNAYGIKTLKVVKGSGSTADLMYYLGKAHEKQDIKRVFYGLDLFALKMPCEVTVVSQYSPNYLYTETILDDGAYLFNKDVLLKKIPLMLAYSFADKNTGGHAYDWSEDKTFGPAKAMEAYEGPYVQSGESVSGEQDAAGAKDASETKDAAGAKNFLPEKDFTDDKEIIAANIALITEEIASHPDTLYTVFFPPYSLLMWDDTCRQGELSEYCYMLDEALRTLLSYDNVEIYYFQTDTDIVCNLDLYMDKVHYSPDINQYMLTCMAQGDESYRVDKDNRQDVVPSLRQMCQYITEKAIYNYYPREQ